MSEKKFKTLVYTNPVDMSGDDPWVVKNGNDYFYCYSVGNGVAVSRIGNVNEISKANGKTVYTAPEGTDYSREYWAPELHYLNGHWYIYVAADDGDNFSHRMYVLRATTSDPTEPFEFVGRLVADNNRWAIDGTVLEFGSELYFVWSGWEGMDNVAQNIYIAHMSDPMTIDSERVLLSKPELEWELHGEPLINEGPAALVKDGTVHIIYSASASWLNDYCLGILTCRDGDLLNAASWVKSDTPILSQGEKSYGPGHCSFVDSLDGKTTYVVYHANLVSNSGWRGRTVRVQPISWNGDMPYIGAPAEPGKPLEAVAFE